jgi:hypothetical protein
MRKTATCLILIVLGSLVVHAAQSEPGGQIELPVGIVGAQVQMFGMGSHSGGYLKTTYEMGSMGIESTGTTSTEIIPQEDGSYRYITHTEETMGGAHGGLIMGGIPLPAMGMSISVASSDGGMLDLDPLTAVEQEVLEPNRSYLLPDGGHLETHDAGVIAGVDVVYATYTQQDSPNSRLSLAIASDLEVRNALTSPPLIRLEMRMGASGPYEMMNSMKLIEYTTSP